jgi:hypothetical protein
MSIWQVTALLAAGILPRSGIGDRAADQGPRQTSSGQESGHKQAFGRLGQLTCRGNFHFESSYNSDTSFTMAYVFRD